jgi:NAD(P)-dependent dehydrogenase (short-subunit alcohol dehydrogenase family)
VPHQSRLILTTQEAVRHFGEGGVVVNIGSVVGKLALPGATVYSATNAAVESITRTLIADLGPKKIRVNAVNPGMVQTEGNYTAQEGSAFREVGSATGAATSASGAAEAHRRGSLSLHRCVVSFHCNEKK